MDKVLLKGNEAMAEAAVRAGGLAYFSYPITPQSEIAEYLSHRMPEVGGVFLQAESEIAVAYMVFGAGLQAGCEVAWVPSYSPEMRGGTAYCTVVLSSRPIGSPIIEQPKHLVATNRPALEQFAAEVKPAGVVIINSSLIDTATNRNDLDELKVPTLEIARASGNVKAANIVALAALVAKSKIIALPFIR
ncbi:MAG: 2-oxoacid:acceptor oxidoreductase family protein [Thermodesulfobacteriota bacterium]